MSDDIVPLIDLDDLRDKLESIEILREENEEQRIRIVELAETESRLRNRIAILMKDAKYADTVNRMVNLLQRDGHIQ